MSGFTELIYVDQFRGTNSCSNCVLQVWPMWWLCSSLCVPSAHPLASPVILHLDNGESY